MLDMNKPKRIPLHEYFAATGMSQACLGKAVGRTQGAISQMVLNPERRIFVILGSDSQPESLEEVVTISSDKKRSAVK